MLLALAAFVACLCAPRAGQCAEPVPQNESAASSSQKRDEPVRPSSMQRFRGETELGAFLATPFQGSGGSRGFGWRFALGIGWDRVPLTFGIGGQGAYFAKSSSRARIAVGSEVLEVEKARADSVLFLDFLVRLQPPYWPVRPYLEAIAGPKRLRTDYAVTLVGGTGSTEAMTEDDWTYTVGLGAGVDLPLSERLWLTGGVRYLAGGTASYTRVVAGAGAAAIRYTTGTTITTFSLGMAARFGHGQGG